MEISPSTKRKLLRKWIDQYYNAAGGLSDSFKPKGSFFDGSFDKIEKILGKNISRPWPELQYEDLKRELLSCTAVFIFDIWFEVKAKEMIPPMEVEKCRHALIKRYTSFVKFQKRFPFIPHAPKIEKSFSDIIFLLQDAISELGRRQLNRPLFNYIYALTSFHYGWTGKHAPSTIESKFLKLILYCVEALRLNSIWTDDAVQEMIGEVIKRLPRHGGRRLI
ncbi:MAG: hypothetical protein ABSB22_01375 [Thermodesulfobacteriota bacterium]|jgi:hypothetical protein